MKPLLFKKTNIAIVVLGILLIVYEGSLLWSNYVFQTQFVVTFQKRIVSSFERQAMAVGYFFSEREQDLRALSDSKEISTYFENKALGMSMAYGLATSLVEMRQPFTTLLQVRQIDNDKIYDWIAFIKTDGVALTAAFSNENMAIREEFKQITGMTSTHMGIRLEEKNNEPYALITTPYYFKNQLKGYIAASLSLHSVLHNLVDEKKISDASRVYLICTQCDVLFPRGNTGIEKRLMDHFQTDVRPSGTVHIDNPVKNTERLTLIFARIDHTPFVLLNVLSDDDFSSGVNPGKTILFLLILSVSIFGGMGFLIWNNIQKLLLVNKYNASVYSAEQFKEQNNALAMEIAQRTKVEEKLEKANKDLTKTSITLNCILESATQFAITAIDSAYRIIHFNPAAERILNVESADVMGHSILDIHTLHNVDENRFACAIEIAESQGQYEYDIFSNNVIGVGDRWLHAVVMPMRDNEKTVGFIFFGTDTTLQHRSEEELLVSEEKYRTLIENMPDIVFSMDKNRKVTEIKFPQNQSYGLNAKEIIQKTYTHFIHKDDRERVNDLLLSDLTHQKKYQLGLRFRLVPGDNKVHWVELNLHYQYDDGGLFLKANGVLRDLSIQKSLENQLIRSERLAAAGQLAASIAHEINSPLAGISALLALVRKRNINDSSALENIDLIRNALDAIGGIVKNLLNLNRPSLNKRQRADLNTIVQETVTLTNAYLKKKAILLTMDLSPSLPAFDCYPQELRQVFINFINNTIEAIESDSESDKKGVDTGSDPREIVIKTTSDLEKIVVEYLDTGPGIADQDLYKIFDPFFTNKKIMGMGIGLALCHDIIVRHNGNIRAVSTKKGAHFIIEFFI